MTGLHELQPAAGTKRNRKRVGRGDASGTGKTAGKGNKGQNARSGAPYLFEGGQLPLIKRLPYMLGFNNRNRVEYSPVNLTQLELLFETGADVTPKILLERRVLRRKQDLVKVLGGGDFSKKLNVSAHAFSKTAREKIEKAGGTVTVVEAAKGG
ncbi:MAG: 50S ribosomal protein L15 [Chloroflexi bacterium]|nr:50S ribosomal protein L15 [Chloroflexota bacterium]